MSIFNGPIVVIEDDSEDKEIFLSILSDLGISNVVHWFVDANTALDFLNMTQETIYIIFCDVFLPGGMDGLQLKMVIDNTPELRRKSIPFIFLSIKASQKTIDTAYMKLDIQGFFLKGNNYSSMRAMFGTIFSYWMQCKHPKVV